MNADMAKANKSAMVAVPGRAPIRIAPDAVRGCDLAMASTPEASNRKQIRPLKLQETSAIICVHLRLSCSGSNLQSLMEGNEPLRHYRTLGTKRSATRNAPQLCNLLAGCSRPRTCLLERRGSERCSIVWPFFIRVRGHSLAAL